jgi:hypothetical protein
VQRKIDPSGTRGYLLALKPPGKKCALRVITAFDKKYQAFEQEAGGTALTNALEWIRALESHNLA